MATTFHEKRSKAIDWWGDLDAEAIAYWMLQHYPNRDPFSLTGREIQTIYEAASKPNVPPAPKKAEYKVKYVIMTARAGAKDGEIVGSSFHGECVIWAYHTLEELKKFPDAIKGACAESISEEDLEMISEAGTITNIFLQDIIPV